MTDIFSKFPSIGFVLPPSTTVLLSISLRFRHRLERATTTTKTRKREKILQYRIGLSQVVGIIGVDLRYIVTTKTRSNRNKYLYKLQSWSKLTWERELLWRRYVDNIRRSSLYVIAKKHWGMYALSNGNGFFTVVVDQSITLPFSYITLLLTCIVFNSTTLYILIIIVVLSARIIG